MWPKSNSDVQLSVAQLFTVVCFKVVADESSVFYATPYPCHYLCPTLNTVVKIFLCLVRI